MIVWSNVIKGPDGPVHIGPPCAKIQSLSISLSASSGPKFFSCLGLGGVVYRPGDVVAMNSPGTTFYGILRQLFTTDKDTEVWFQVEWMVTRQRNLPFDVERVYSMASNLKMAHIERLPQAVSCLKGKVRVADLDVSAKRIPGYVGDAKAAEEDASFALTLNKVAASKAPQGDGEEAVKKRRGRPARKVHDKTLEPPPLMDSADSSSSSAGGSSSRASSASPSSSSTGSGALRSPRKDGDVRSSGRNGAGARGRGTNDWKTGSNRRRSGEKRESDVNEVAPEDPRKAAASAAAGAVASKLGAGPVGGGGGAARIADQGFATALSPSQAKPSDFDQGGSSGKKRGRTETLPSDDPRPYFKVPMRHTYHTIDGFLLEVCIPTSDEK